eukprot:193956_1
MMQRTFYKLSQIKCNYNSLLYNAYRRFDVFTSVRNVLAKAHENRRVINLDVMTQEFKFLPDELKNLVSKFYGVNIHQTQTLENTQHKYFIEISNSENANLLNQSEIFIKHCIKNGFIHTPNTRYNVPDSVINTISFKTGCFVYKIPTGKYLCFPNMNSKSKQSKIDIELAINNIECKTISNLNYSEKDIDIIFNTIPNKIERLKWQYSFAIWIDNVTQNNRSVDVNIGYYDTKHEITNIQRQDYLLQLHDEILTFFMQNQFIVMSVSNYVLENVQEKWNEFWKNIRCQTELVTMSIYDTYIIFKTKKDIGTSGIQKCKEWLTDYIEEIDSEQEYELIMDEFEDSIDIDLDTENMLQIDDGEDLDVDTKENLFVFSDDLFEKQDKIIADEIEGKEEVIMKDLKYNRQLFKECTAPVISEIEFNECDGNVGEVNIRRVKGVGKVMEKALNGYDVVTVLDLYENREHVGVKKIKGINKVLGHVITLIESK